MSNLTIRCAQQRLEELRELEARVASAQSDIARLQGLKPVLEAAVAGKVIQYRETNSCEWRDSYGVEFILSADQYRIKPDLTVGYRRYIYKAGSQYRVATLISTSAAVAPGEIETSLGAGFVRWIDTEWQYAEVQA